MSIKYYFRVGDTGDTMERPGGIYRETDDESGLRYEFLNARGEWEVDMDLYRHFGGPDFTADVIPVSLKQAEKAIADWAKRFRVPRAPAS